MRKFTDLLVFIFFLFSLFYTLKNLFFSQNRYTVIEDYKESIARLKELLQREKEENEKLRQELSFIETHPNETTEIFIRDYLQMVKKNEGVYRE